MSEHISEGNLLSEIFSTRPASKTPDFEGKHITGREWVQYKLTLGISSETLQGKKVLNFGSGGSNIGEELKKEGIVSQVVDLDLKFDPIGVDPYYRPHPFKFILAHYANVPLKIFKHGKIHDKLVNIRRQFSGTDGRTFVQGDGRSLPFPDRAFDYVLAFASTYQIYYEAKEKVYRELMRVGKILHLGPIYKIDFDIIQKLAKEVGYEIVACRSIPNTMYSDVPFGFDSDEDYVKYINRHSEPFRVRTPISEDAKVKTILGRKRGFGGGGSTIVLIKNH